MTDERHDQVAGRGTPHGGRHAIRPRAATSRRAPANTGGPSRHATRAGTTVDPEGTGTWTPNWDDDDDDQPAPSRQPGRLGPSRPAPAGQPAQPGRPAPYQPAQRQPAQGQPAHGQPDRPTRHYYVTPPPGSPPAARGRDRSEDPTDFIPRRPGGPIAPEPQLYTHREIGFQDPYGHPELDEAEPELDEAASRRKKIWRWVRRTCYALALLFVLGPILTFLVGYFTWDVPNAAVLAAAEQKQIVTVYYADGQTELAQIVPQGENRINVSLEQVPKHVQDAVLAAEDRSYWSNPGFDPIGIARAVWKQATGGAGGGSTITQQYVKVATKEDEYSLRRKFRELVLSTKISQQYSKEDILENYLNIVYFGRQAYGIQAASQAYFKKDVKDLTVAEGALLAGMIQSPSRSDPAKNRPRAEGRWNFVLDGMVSQGWLDAGQRSAEVFPETVPLDQARAGAVTDSRRHIQERALSELEALGFDTDTVHDYGGKVITTIDPRAQQAATDAINKQLEGQPPNLHASLVAVDPKTGAIRAYFGGNDGTGLDLASSDKLFQSPGSAFKPFVMLAALEQGKGLGDVYPGNSPLKIGPVTCHNSESANYGSVSLKKAMTQSVNTTFCKLTDEIGPDKVAEAAHRAGIPETVNGQRTLVNSDGTPPGLSISLGALPVRTLDMASAYATFAANGVKRQPFLISEYLDAEGQSVYKHADSAATNALDQNDGKRNAQLACNVTESLKDVAAHSKFALKGGRASAAKTGTDQRGGTNENDNSWTVGYTPSISAAVWVGDPAQTAIKTKTGKNIFGATIAGPTWKAFMDAYLEPIKPADDKFPKCEPLGKEDEVTPAPPPPSASQPPTTTTEQPTRTRPTITRPTRPTRTTTRSEEPTSTSCIPFCLPTQQGHSG